MDGCATSAIASLLSAFNSLMLHAGPLATKQYQYTTLEHAVAEAQAPFFS